MSMMSEEIILDSDSDDDIQVCEVVEKSKVKDKSKHVEGEIPKVPEAIPISEVRQKQKARSYLKTWTPLRKLQIKEYVNSFEEGEEDIKNDILSWIFFQGNLDVKVNDDPSCAVPWTRNNKKETSTAGGTAGNFLCSACETSFSDEMSLSNHDCHRLHSNSDASALSAKKDKEISKDTASCVISEETSKGVTKNMPSTMTTLLNQGPSNVPDTDRLEASAINMPEKPRVIPKKSNLFCFLCEMLFSSREMLSAHHCPVKNPKSNKPYIKKEPPQESTDAREDIQERETTDSVGEALQPVVAVEAVDAGKIVQPIDAGALQTNDVTEASCPVGDTEVSQSIATEEADMLNVTLDEQSLHDWESTQITTESFHGGVAPVIAETFSLSQRDRVESDCSTEGGNDSPSRISENLTELSSQENSPGGEKISSMPKNDTINNSDGCRKLPFLCFICGHYFNRHDTYDQHTKKCIRRNGHEDADIVNHTYICMICENIFTNEEVYKNHSKNCKETVQSSPQNAIDQVKQKRKQQNNPTRPSKVRMTEKEIEGNSCRSEISKALGKPSPESGIFSDSGVISGSSHTHLSGTRTVIRKTFPLPLKNQVNNSNDNGMQQCSLPLIGNVGKDLKKSESSVNKIKKGKSEVYSVNRPYSCADCKRTFILKKSLDIHTCFSTRTSELLSSAVKRKN